jgi:hypothetical protein
MKTFARYKLSSATASTLCLLTLACSDAARSPTSITERTAQSRPISASPLVPAYHYDAPPARPFDDDAALLDAELNATARRAVIQIKAPSAQRSLQNGGSREAMDGVAFDAALAAFRALGITILQQYDRLGMILVSVPSAATAALAKSPFVDFINPDRAAPLQAGGQSIVSTRQTASPAAPISAATSSPTSAMSMRMSGAGARRLPSNGTGGLANDLASEYATNWGVNYVNAAPAWQTTTGANVVVMHMSVYGMSLGHWDLPAITSDHCGGYFGPCDGTNSHLENRSATAWFALRNGEETVGIAPGIPPQNIWVWRACDDQQFCYFSTIASGISSAIDQGVKVISFSDLGFTTNDPTLSSAIGNALAHDVVIAAPAIADASTQTFPASYIGVVGVSGILSDGAFAFANASNNPCGIGSGSGAKVAVAAPFYETEAVDAGPYYFAVGAICGTPVSTDYVAGVLTLIRSAYPALNADDVKGKLFAAARPAGSAQYFGAGIVNAAAAVSTLSASISGPSSVRPFATCEWTANASGGSSPYTFSWYAVSTSGSGPYFDYTNGVADGGSFTVQLTLTDAVGTTRYVNKNVNVSSSAPTCIF